MLRLRFSTRFYRIQAVETAARYFKKAAVFRVKAEPRYVTVRVSGIRPESKTNLADEFSNLVLELMRG